ncbi:MAG: transposase [Marinifilaceae bacterium]|jgi:transposase|nr:transposase [Marinifilaceae bacterium]
MNLICKKCFLKADIVSDRFHVQQLANDAVQKLRIEYRWATIDDENERIAKEKEEAKKLDANKPDTTVKAKEINQNKQA